MKNSFLKLLIAFLLLSGLTNVNAQSIYEQMEGKTDVVVDKNGLGDFTTVQEAINSIADNNDTWKIIFIKKGVYNEKVILGYKKTKVIIVGEDVDSTIITYNDYANKMLPGGHTFSTYTFRADANDFQAYNITFQNSATATLGQGVAFHSNGDRQILYHCRILGDQDTYFDNFRTRRYIKDCYIEGGVDFIFGFGVTLFDSCQIHSSSAGYITAASTPQYYKFGYVFNNCRLTGAPKTSGISLGRPWFDWSNTAFFKCWEPASIIAGGWSSWDGREKTCFYREYKCFGPGADTSKRVSFGKQLDYISALKYTIDTILAASNFPSNLGYSADTAELMHLYRRFEGRGYPERADTILYAGRDKYPSYPTEDWKPEFNQDIFNIIKNNTYRMMDSINGEYTIEKILCNGNEIDGFDPDVLKYGVEFPSGDTTIPILTVLGERIRTKTTYPKAVPGLATVVVTSKDGVNGITYSVYLSKDSAYWETELMYIVINKKDTINFEDGKFEYNVTILPGITKITDLITKKKITEQTFAPKYPASLPGTLTIEVTAPDKITKNTYTVNLNLASGLPDKNEANNIVLINPVTDKLQIFNNTNSSANGEIMIYDQKGTTIYTGKLNLSNGLNELDIDLYNLTEGFYFFTFKINEKSYTGKFIKTNTRL